MIDRFKQLIRKNNIKSFFKNYIGTCMCIALFTLYAVIFNFEESTFIATGLLFAGVGFFFVETVIKKSHRIIGYILFALMAIGFAILIEKNPSIKLEMAYGGLMLIAFLTSLYYIVKEKNDLADYITRSTTNMFKVELITGIVVIGSLIMFLLVNYLLFDIDEEYYLKAVYVILGMYSVPFGLMSLVDTKEPTMGFVDAVLSKILIPIMNAIFALMLIYICKIVFTLELPKNEIFVYVLELFIIMVPLAMVAKKFPGKYYEYNNKYLGYLFIAPLVLQIYALGIRIFHYGLTISRYVGIFVIIFEIITIVLMSYRHQKYFPRILLVGALIAFILLVVPYVNAYDSMVLYHSGIIKHTMSKKEIANLSLEERQKIYNSYDYLDDLGEDALKKVENLVNKENINEICDEECIKGTNNYTRDYIYLNYSNKSDEIDVSKYKTIKRINKYFYDKDLDGTVVTIEKQKVDLAKYLKYVEENKDHKDVEKEFDKFVSNNGVIKVNDKVDLIIEYFSIRYDKNNNSFDSVDVEGYFLYR